MAFEVIRGEDLRIVLSHLAQTAYGTRLTDANLTAGKSFRLNAAVPGELTPVRAQEGSRPFTGHEWPDGTLERDILRDTRLSIAMAANSFMCGWTAAFAFASVTSVQEGVTTHFTHTSRPSNPLSASGVRQAKVTSIYIDSGSADAGRFRRVYPALAVMGFGLSGRVGEMVQLAIDMVGDGNEVTAPTITIPALESITELPVTLSKIEYGNKAGALTDISERIREFSLRVNQELAEGDGYRPNSGKFRDRIWFLKRSFEISLAIFADRANRDLIDDMLNLTRKEIKFTLDSGVLAGTSPATNHKCVLRFPDVRITEAPISFEAEGALYGVRIADPQVYRDTGVTDTPCTITTDNVQVSYFT